MKQKIFYYRHLLEILEQFVRYEQNILAPDITKYYKNN